jgi:HD-like signal output (HDOD) protein
MSELVISQLGKTTLARLWTRTSSQGDMPGFTKSIGAILGAMRGEEDQEFDMTRTVLSDPVLTQKVLRLANSGMYSAFGRSINTVSKAVLVLGTDAIGHLALGLKLIEELSQASPDSVPAHIEMEKAVLAGMVAQQVAVSSAVLHAEEAVVCSMLHTLGRMMLTFYMADYWILLQQHAGVGVEAAAAEEVLGLTLDQIGQATAERWGLPPHLIAGMRKLAPPEPGADISRADWMAGLCTMSSLCADALWHNDADGAGTVLELVERYAGMLGVETNRLADAIELAREMAAADLTIAPLSRQAGRHSKAQSMEQRRAEGSRIIMSGLADMRDALTTASPGQMISMALETLYQGFDCARAIAFVRNQKGRKYSAKMGLGINLKEMAAPMEFGDAYERDAFHAALHSDRVIFIENAQDPKFATKLPQWWKDTLTGVHSFIILPLSLGNRPSGFIYCDWDDSLAPIRHDHAEFALLNKMRALLVKSFEMRQIQGLTPDSKTA